MVDLSYVRHIRARSLRFNFGVLVTKYIMYHLLKIPVYVASLALFLLMLLTFSDVMLRSILNAPIEFAADLTRVLMAVIVFSVMPTISAKGQQISVDLLDRQFIRYGLVRWREILVSLFCGVILLWPAQRVFVLAERSRSYGDVMEYLGIGLHYIGWFVALMTLITAVALIVRGLLALLCPQLVKDLAID
jgi:TRAP-type C4-dicarboxylate transport system permease small subunit